ncbi:programmed cell death protein 2-like [Mercenaria mercenaria]|uniref:programmed cell death protein 2-like n=1 Tax=Mercenaria mercenaria TaxID=6596 RepID=UPI00234EFC4D|nr:programmed cell death protein 2-like [Mercenaria mercenaria]
MAAPLPKKCVELGFVENSEEFLLRSRFFPSKLGGRPAWLSLESIPTTEQLSCVECMKPTIFLLQVYSPCTLKLETFHRTLFIFVCSNPDCCKTNSNKNLHVFRSQLPRENKFYSSDPSPEIEVQNEVDASLFNKLCVVCGCLGLKTCSKCHNVNYCSKEHQTVHWKSGHKVGCNLSKEADVSTKEVKFDCLFPEMELVTEPENNESEKDCVEKTDEEKMKEYDEFLKKENVSQTCGEMSEAELQKMASKESENDKQLRRFKKRISQEPEQVLRYDKGGEPLWIASDPKPEVIPDCKCGAKRQFEFQVLPHLLSFMNVDKLGASIDWGTLCVYTCSENCSIGNTYSREYIFKQDVV